MKIVCSRQQLVEAVSNVQRAVSTKSSVPALEGILLRTSGGEITLCGYDLELGMTTSIESSVEENGSVVLSARLFADIVRRLPGESVSLTIDEKNITTMKKRLSPSWIPPVRQVNLKRYASKRNIRANVRRLLC